jgi:hypothetical protein
MHNPFSGVSASLVGADASSTSGSDEDSADDVIDISSRDEEKI